LVGRPENFRQVFFHSLFPLSLLRSCQLAPPCLRKSARAAMSCHVNDLDCLRDLLAGVPWGLRIAQALLSDSLALVLIAGCILGLACLGVMVGKIRSLLCEDINGNEEGRQPPTRKLSPQRTPRPRDRWTRGRSPAQSPDANRRDPGAVLADPGAELAARYKRVWADPGAVLAAVQERLGRGTVRAVQAESTQGAPTAPLQAAEPDLPPPGLSARRFEGTPHPEPRAPVAPAGQRPVRRLVCNADKLSNASLPGPSSRSDASSRSHAPRLKYHDDSSATAASHTMILQRFEMRVRKVDVLDTPTWHHSLSCDSGVGRGDCEGAVWRRLRDRGAREDEGARDEGRRGMDADGERRGIGDQQADSSGAGRARGVQGGVADHGQRLARAR